MSKQDPKSPPSSDDAKAEKSEKAKIEVLAEKGKVRVVTDGKRVWKEAPEGSGMGPSA